MPSAVRFGAGFGKDTKYLDQRPCNEFVSAEWQKTHNNFFQRDSSTKARFPDPRPPWFVGSMDSTELLARPQSPGRFGEWKLKWIPKVSPEENHYRGESDSGKKTVIRDTLYGPLVLDPTKASSKLQNSNKSALLSDRDAAVLRSQGQPFPKSPQGQSRSPSNISARSTRPASKHLTSSHQRLFSSRSVAKDSERSGTSYFSGTELSCSASDTSGILQRVKALEDALNGEKAMRERMQALLDNVDKRQISLPNITKS